MNRLRWLVVSIALLCVIGCESAHYKSLKKGFTEYKEAMAHLHTLRDSPGNTTELDAARAGFEQAEKSFASSEGPPAITGVAEAGRALSNVALAEVALKQNDKQQTLRLVDVALEHAQNTRDAVGRSEPQAWVLSCGATARALYLKSKVSAEPVKNLKNAVYWAARGLAADTVKRVSEVPMPEHESERYFSVIQCVDAFHLAVRDLCLQHWEEIPDTELTAVLKLVTGARDFLEGEEATTVAGLEAETEYQIGKALTARGVAEHVILPQLGERADPQDRNVKGRLVAILSDSEDTFFGKLSVPQQEALNTAIQAQYSALSWGPTNTGASQKGFLAPVQAEAFYAQVDSGTGKGRDFQQHLADLILDQGSLLYAGLSPAPGEQHFERLRIILADYENNLAANWDIAKATKSKFLSGKELQQVRAQLVPKGTLASVYNNWKTHRAHKLPVANN